MTRIAAIVVLLAVGAGGTAIRALHSDGSAPVEVAGRAGPIGSHARFVLLSKRKSNRCNLSAGGIRSLPASARLQGACCSPMVESAYRRQARELRRYADIPEIPRDAYDVPVSLARRLLRADDTIHLSPREAGTYREGMAMSPEHGPCCCHCWRWNAFRGLSKILIHERRWPAERIGRLMGSVEGCGGS